MPVSLPIQPELLSECRDAFDLLDADKSGWVEAEELRSALASGVTPAVQSLPVDILGEIFEQLDVDGDGRVSFPEFASMMLALISPEQITPAARLAFSVFDRDGDGKLDATELTGALRALKRSAADANLLLQQFDIDGDGTLELVEFLALLRA